MKRVANWILIAVVAAAVPGVGSLQAQGQQLGSFAVGHSTQILHVTVTPGENRPVNVHLWYPAHLPDNCQGSGNSGGNGDDQGSGGNGDSQGCPVTPSVYTSRLHGDIRVGRLGWDPLSWTIGSSVSFENLPIATGYGPFPVIIFSHGSQNNAIDYVYTLEALASFGFIVAAPDHLNDTQDDVRIDYVNSQAHLAGLAPPIPYCFDGLLWTAQSPCAHVNVSESMTDRVHDVSAIIDALPTWFGDRVDVMRVGVMGHSRGTVTALATAGGSATWGFGLFPPPLPADPRVKAVMGLAIGALPITLGVDLPNVRVPVLLVAGTLDKTLPVSQAAFGNPCPPSTTYPPGDCLPASTENQLVLIENANHRHFDSGLCAQTQSSGAIASVDPSANLDLHTLRGLVINPTGNGVAMDFCELETFTSPSNIQTKVTSLTTFNFATTPVPTTGLDSAEVKDQVIELAVLFFGHVL